MKIKGRVYVSPGQYLAEFLGVEATDHPEYGPGLLWEWLVVGGKFDGQKVGRTTGDTATSKNACGRMFKAVTGRQWHVEGDNDVEPSVGRRYHLIVEDAPSGDGTRVASAVAAAEESDPPKGETDAAPGNGDDASF
jgi:hypothetical protein